MYVHIIILIGTERAITHQYGCAYNIYVILLLRFLLYYHAILGGGWTVGWCDVIIHDLPPDFGHALLLPKVRLLFFSMALFSLRRIWISPLEKQSIAKISIFLTGYEFLRLQGDRYNLIQNHFIYTNILLLMAYLRWHQIFMRKKYP